MQFECEKNKQKGRANPRRVHGPEEFHSNICIESVELEICVNRCYQVLANGAFRYSRDFVECVRSIYIQNYFACITVEYKISKLVSLSEIDLNDD